MSALRGFVVVLLGGIGIMLIGSARPRVRRAVLSRRLTPYLAALGPQRSALLGIARSSADLGAVFDPIVERIGRRLQRVLDDGHELPERLQAAGSRLDPSGFRAEQVTWGLAGLIGGLVLGLMMLRWVDRFRRCSWREWRPHSLLAASPLGTGR